MLRFHFLYVGMVLLALGVGKGESAGYMFGDPETHFLGCFKDLLPASQMKHTR